MCRLVTDATCDGSRRKTKKWVYVRVVCQWRSVQARLSCSSFFYFTLLITTYWHVQGDLCYCGIKEGMSMIHIRGLHTHTHPYITDLNYDRPRGWETWYHPCNPYVLRAYVESVRAALNCQVHATVEAVVSWIRCVCGQNILVCKADFENGRGVVDRIRRIGCCCRF